ncbi:MAG: hypothetical protein K2X29_01405 [Candidatus Obscuribacterales bacterium]|nr:hypothetical protein [Candidatus Obscuribacterales bacterium]
MTSKQRKPLTDLAIANISLKQFDAETKSFAPGATPEEPTPATPEVRAEKPIPVAAAPVQIQPAAEKDTKRLTIDLDEDMNRKFSVYALEHGKKKTEIIREWISAALSAG